MSVNEARSAEDTTRTLNDLIQRSIVGQPPNRSGQHQVRSSPDNTERHRIIALGLDPAIPSVQRPSFVSSENVARVQHLLLSDAHYIQHGAIRQLPDLQQRGQAPNPSTRANRPGTSQIEQMPTMAGNFRHSTQGLRDALRQSPDIAVTMASIERSSMPPEEEEEAAHTRSYDSAVDDPKTFPALPSVTRHHSEQLDRGAAGSHLGKWSLPDLRKIDWSFSRVPALVGTTDPALILRLLDAHPSIDALYMSPVLRPTDPNYTSYLMHVVHPGKVDILNCCVVTRKNVIRYIKGKEPRCLSLKRWSFEQNAMLRLRRIPFFKNFKMMKAFYALGTHLDMSRFGKTRRKLRSQLLSCNPNYAETLLLVRTMCLDMAALTMIHVDTELTYTLGEFLEDQERYAQEVIAKMERYMAILLYLVSRMCWDDVFAEGLAEESKARKGSAPKRVNEIRKMQRLRQSSPGAGPTLMNTDDINIGSWITGSEPSELEELERKKKERCAMLSRFIYLVDCLIREALYEMYTSSLQKTVNFLRQHLLTFPSDDGISAIVKAYVGDIDDSYSFSTYDDDDDDDDDNDDGKGGGGLNFLQDGQMGNNKKQIGKQDPGDQSEHEAFADKTPTAQAQNKQQDDQANTSRARPATETETSSTWTTLGMSSSIERLSTDTDEFGTPTIMDNALYIPARDGETDLSDSLDTTSSTFSEDGGNINPLGSDLGNLADTGGDNINTMMNVGMEMRFYIPNLHDVPNQPVDDAHQQGAPTDPEADLDDVTVIERLSNTLQSRQRVSGFQHAAEINGQCTSQAVQNSIDDTEDELTITSEETSSFTSKSTNLLSNKGILNEDHITEDGLLDEARGSGCHSRIFNKAINQSNTHVYSSTASGIMAAQNSSRYFSRKDLVATRSRKTINSVLTMLQEKAEIYESDSSDSLCTLPIEKLSINEIKSPPNQLSLPCEKITRSNEKSKSTKRNEIVIKMEDTGPDAKRAVSSHFSPKDTLGPGISDTVQSTSHQAKLPVNDGGVNDGRLQGIFNGLFRQKCESSVDTMPQVEHHRSNQSSQILGGASRVSGYFDSSYTQLRKSQSSSVDENVVVKNGNSPSSTQIHHSSKSSNDSAEIVARPREMESRVKKEAHDSEDDTTISCDSVGSFDDYFTCDRHEKWEDKNASHDKPPENDKLLEKKSDTNKSTQGTSDEKENEALPERSMERIYPVTEYRSDLDDRWLPGLDYMYRNIDIARSVSTTSSDYYDEEKSGLYINANPSPNTEEEEEKFEPANFFLSDAIERYHQVGSVFRKVVDFPAVTQGHNDDMLTKDKMLGVRKDGGKRRKVGKPTKEEVVSQTGATTSKDNNFNDVEKAVPGSPQQAIKTTVSLDDSDSYNAKKVMKNNAAISQSSPGVISEESTSAKDLQQLVNVLPEALPLLFRIQQNDVPKYDLDHSISAHGLGHNIHFTSANSSYVKYQSNDSVSVAEEDQSIEILNQNLPVNENIGLIGRKPSEDPARNENDTENDLTESIFGSTTEENIQSNDVSIEKEIEIKTNANNEKVVATDSIKSHQSSDNKQVEESNDDKNETNRLEKDDDTSRKSGAGGGGSGGGGGGGGGGINEDLPNNKKHWATNLKPMFHASLNIVRELVCITPDVYDFTAGSFNIVHDIEMCLRSMDNLTSNPAFLTFTQPSADGQTSVDKKPKGPSLDRVLRFDKNVVNLKNSVYGSIDNMFHSVAVYIKEMQTLYLKYFQDRHLELNNDHRDVDFYCKHLQRYDVQLKIADRLPESQRLGMFLIDLTPYKEYVRYCTFGSLQQLQLEINADVVRRTRALIEKLNDLHFTLESHPTTLVPLFKRLTALDSYNELLQDLEASDISQIGALYSIIDRFDIPHTEVDRRAFESTHYLMTSARHVAEACQPEREGMVEALEKCLCRDVRYLYFQVKRVVRPLVEAEFFLDGKTDPVRIQRELMETEDVVRTHVAMANFVREVQRYLKLPVTRFTELFNLAARYYNIRNLWLLMADWDVKLEKWKNQSFQTLDIQEINSYTFKYMEACDKLEKLLPKNTVISAFEDKMDIMLRWLNFIIEFRGQAVKPRHWSQIEEVLGVEFGEMLPLTLASLMSINAIEKQKNLHVVLNKARAESNVQNEYDEVDHQCRSLNLPVQTRQKFLVDGEPPVNAYYLGDTFEVEESMNYFVMELERIELSPHSGFLHDTLEEFVQQIFEALEKLVQWMEMQMKLSRLRRLIMRHPEVSQSLPSEVERYKQIYMAYSDFVATIYPDPNAMRWCRSQELESIMESQHDEIVRLYRTFKRDIEVRGGQENNHQDAQQQFGTWVVM